MPAITATTSTPIPAPQPAAFPAVAKGPPLLGAFAGIAFDVGGAVGIKVIVVSPPVTVITDVTGVADHDEELEDELSNVFGVVGGADVLVVLDGIGIRVGV